MKPHQERAHSKFSASGAERWFNCPGSVKLSEGLPDVSSKWAKEGTLAHEVLENILTRIDSSLSKASPEMIKYADEARYYILRQRTKHGEIQVEQKVYLDWIHKDAFGTLDAAVINHFDILHVFDYKYGAGFTVSPIENLQMIFYALAVAHLYHWNFKKARLWIIQPRARGYQGPTYWDVSMRELKGRWQAIFKQSIEMVNKYPDQYLEGSWCHWCKAKKICPLKNERKLDSAKNIFDGVPLNT